MSPLFDVPADELRVERINLPNGRYTGDFAGAEFIANNNGWRAIKPKFTNLATADGSPTVATQWKGKDVTITLVSREQSTTYTVEAANDTAREIGGRDIVRLAQALGVAETSKNGDGEHVSVPGETPEEVLELLNSRIGTRVNFSVKNAPRLKNKVPVLDDKGEPRIDDTIQRVWALDK